MLTNSGAGSPAANAVREGAGDGGEVGQALGHRFLECYRLPLHLGLLEPLLRWLCTAWCYSSFFGGEGRGKTGEIKMGVARHYPCDVALPSRCRAERAARLCEITSGSPLLLEAEGEIFRVPLG